MYKTFQPGLLVAALSALFACTQTTPESDLEAGGDWTNSDGNSWTPDESDEELVDSLQESKEGLVGFYAMRGRVARIQDLPLFGETPSVTVTLGISEIRWQDEDLVLSEAGCHVEVESDNVATIIPDIIPQSTLPRVGILDVFEEEDGSLGWSRERISTPVGVNLENPETDSLPTTEDDVRVFDQDGDGQSGITIFVTAIISGEIYAVQRQRDEYNDGVLQNGDLRAFIDDTTQQSVIGASNFALNTNVIQNNDPDETKSFIVMKPLEGPLNCDELYLNLDTIFND